MAKKWVKAKMRLFRLAVTLSSCMSHRESQAEYSFEIIHDRGRERFRSFSRRFNLPLFFRVLLLCLPSPQHNVRVHGLCVEVQRVSLLQHCFCCRKFTLGRSCPHPRNKSNDDGRNQSRSEKMPVSQKFLQNSPEKASFVGDVSRARRHSTAFFVHDGPHYK
jgi:hypothetical protein